MERVDVTIHSFIVKVVIEKVKDGPPSTWHGQITHIGSGKTKSMKDLAEIDGFISQYLPRETHGILPRLKRLLK